MDFLPWPIGIDNFKNQIDVADSRSCRTVAATAHFEKVVDVQHFDPFQRVDDLAVGFSIVDHRLGPDRNIPPQHIPHWQALLQEFPTNCGTQVGLSGAAATGDDEPTLGVGGVAFRLFQRLGLPVLQRLPAPEGIPGQHIAQAGLLQVTQCPPLSHTVALPLRESTAVIDKIDIASV